MVVIAYMQHLFWKTGCSRDVKAQAAQLQAGCGPAPQHLQRAQAEGITCVAMPAMRFVSAGSPLNKGCCAHSINQQVLFLDVSKNFRPQ